MRAYNLVSELGHDFFLTLDGMVSPKMEIVERPKFVNGNKLFVQIWFDPESADKFRVQECASLIIIDREDNRLYLIEGVIEKLERQEEEEMQAIQERFYQSQSLWGVTLKIRTAKSI
ncbi:MAG: hypothetical protein AB1650_00380 [Candidatus Omnitrophota bacterium]